MNDNLKGAALMLVTMAAFSGTDAVMKFVLHDLALFQSVFMRGLFATALLASYLGARSGLRPQMTRRDRGRIWIRAGLEFLATVFFFSALQRMPFANLSAIMQALPLTVTLGAALFLGHRFGIWRLASILIGFVGVMLIVQPGPDGFAEGAGYALAAVAVVTARELLTRTFSLSVPSIYVALVTAVAITSGAGIASLWQGWHPVNPVQVVALAVAAGFILVAYVTSVSAMRVGEIAFVTPFRYSALLWALALGLFFFDEVPATIELVGAAIIVGMGLFTFYRERRANIKLAQKARVEPN